MTVVKVNNCDIDGVKMIAYRKGKTPTSNDFIWALKATTTLL